MFYSSSYIIRYTINTVAASTKEGNTLSSTVMQMFHIKYNSHLYVFYKCRV
uniref:Uncharacterized protein n=1 Tax=Anguilla anguilla TaxID=7936 RepID=A0A0E9QTQ6_ANGAN